MTRTSYVEICVSNFEQSIKWFEDVLGFRVVAREEDEYAELRREETFIQLASDHAPYWESERPRLLPPGQRGSGVEIVLLVDDVDAVYRQAQQAQAEIARPLAEYPWHMRQFWVRHPDGYLIRPAQRLLSVKPDVYLRQISAAFRGEKPKIAQELLPIKNTADGLAQQGDYLGAASIYEMLVTEIFDRSHLYSDEEEEYDDYDEYYEEERYHPEEEGLGDFVKGCIDALGNGLANEQADRVAREKIIQVLFEIYEHDIDSGSVGLAEKVAHLLVSNTTPLERQTIADWIHDLLVDDTEEISVANRQTYGGFLLELEKDTLDDETYLQICRETNRTYDLMHRLLALKRVDEAIQEAEQVSDSELLNIANIFIEHAQDKAAERLVQERAWKAQNRQLLEWLKKYYQTRENYAAALRIAEEMFRTYPHRAGYQEISQLAQQVGRWETLRPELLDFLNKTQNTSLLIYIAIDEGEIDKALELVKSESKQDRSVYGSWYGSAYRYGSIALDVARAAEETRPRAALEIYQQHVEWLIALKERKHYQAACTYLVKMRALYEKLGESEVWRSYIAALRERNRHLPALRDEMAKAKL